MNILEEFFPLRRHQITPGSERLVRLMRSQEGQAALQLRCVLIVGTNGKGSTARMLEAELARQNFVVGTYASPHFVDPLERIRIQSKNAEPRLVKAAKETVKSWVEKNLPDATFFEITTAIALLCFYRAQVDFGVVEAGIGARFDSTNALSPLVTVLTSVGLDHMNFLGPDEESIAFDKSFGSRRGRPLVCGYVSEAAMRGVSRALEITGAYCVFAEEDLSQHSPGKIMPDTSGSDPLPPKMRNALTAYTTLKVLKELLPFPKPLLGSEVIRRLCAMPLPGRFDIRNASSIPGLNGFDRQIIFDNGHNPNAIQALLRQYADSNFAESKYNLVFGSLKDKDYQTSFKLLSNRAETVTMIAFSHEESLTLEDISGFPKAHPYQLKDIRQALLTNFSQNDLPHLVTGSFAFVGEVMKELAIYPDVGV